MVPSVPVPGTQFVLSPATLRTHAAWLENTPASGDVAWHVVAAADEAAADEAAEAVDLLAELAPRCPGLRAIHFHVTDEAALPHLDALAGRPALRAVAVRAVVVLPEPEGEAFERGVALLRAAHGRARLTAVGVLPLDAGTIGRVFAGWHRLVREGLPWRMAVGPLTGAPSLVRSQIAEMIENAIHHPDTPVTDLSLYRFERQRVEEEGRGQLGDPVATHPADAPAADAIARGHVALAGRDEDARDRAVAVARDFRLDKWWLLARGGASAALAQLPGGGTPARGRGRQVLVIGWYGTETAGDKAILAGLLQEIHGRVPDAAVTVVSSLPFYTRKTLDELGYGDEAGVCAVDLEQIDAIMEPGGLVLMGGGPMMDLVEMFDLVRIFRLARRRGLRTLIAGCGVGPARWPITRWATRTMVSLSDAVVLRDRASRVTLEEWGAAPDRVQAGLDPALSYVGSLRGSIRREAGTRPRLGLTIRDWPSKFALRVSKEEFARRQAELVSVWARLCDRFIEQFDGEVHLIPMHTLHIGDDDRWFHGDVRDRAKRRDRVTCHTGSYSAADVAGIIGSMDALVTMRYHSLLFASALGVPSAIVDYTGGQKVLSFARHLQVLGDPFDIATFEPEPVIERLRDLLDNRATLSERLLERTGEMFAASRSAGQAAADLLEDKPPVDRSAALAALDATETSSSAPSRA